MIKLFKKLSKYTNLACVLITLTISSNVFGSCKPTLDNTTQYMNVTHIMGSFNVHAFIREDAFCSKKINPQSHSCERPLYIGENSSKSICYDNELNWCQYDFTNKITCLALNKDQCDLVNFNNRGCHWIHSDVDQNKLVDAVCRVYQIATGTAGKAFAAVGVISVGIGFFTGKVSWGLMISVAAGIAVFFGAPSIIAVISGDQSATALCSNVSQ